MLKRLFDIVVSSIGLILISPILIPLIVATWLQDFHSPFYVAPRVGRNGRVFKMVKLRSMVRGADRTGVDSTSANDARITALGRFIRTYKVDELMQLWNVLKDDMSIVGPRPNIQRATDAYTLAERELLAVRPGITDIASIVFADEGDILKHSDNPDLDYEQLIRPWKSRLGLLYVKNSSFLLDVKLIFLTVVAIFSRKKALQGIEQILNNLKADDMLKRAARRREALLPFPPPGANEIVTSRGPTPMPYKSQAIPSHYFLIADFILLPLAASLSFILRFNEVEMVQYVNTILTYAGLAALIKPVIFYLFGLYRRNWRYASANDLLTIAFATFFAAATVNVIMISLISLLAPLGILPRSIPFLDWLVSTALIGGVRFAPRLTWERPISALVGPKLGFKQADQPRQRVLIAGAGDAGASIAREMKSNPRLGLEPIGFIDDNPTKIGMLLRDLPVLGSSLDLPRLVQTHQINQVLIAMPTAPGKAIRRIVALCQETGVKYQTIPGIYELISGQVSINFVRDIRIEDLLRREPVEVDEPGISSYLANKRVLITGAGGSIGSELTRQVARYNPAQLILLGHGENSIYAIALEMQNAFLDLDVQPFIADIRDTERIKYLFQRYQPQVIFHAAAHKHVPLMEANACEAVANNVLGTQIILEAAYQAQAERLVLISSDKAVNPVNIMGATKRAAELLVQDMAQRIAAEMGAGRKLAPTCVAVRFGNVLGSRGSVVPLFKQQIAEGGPITVTHPDMERFFMTIPEAVHLVIQAAALGQGGEIFVLDMGQSLKIVDLARDLIELSGLKPGEDIDIVFTGPRPGEQLSERLFSEQETVYDTAHPKIRVIANNSRQPLLLPQPLIMLKEAIARQDEAQIYTILANLLPNAKLAEAAQVAKSSYRLS